MFVNLSLSFSYRVKERERGRVGGRERGKRTNEKSAFLFTGWFFKCLQGSMARVRPKPGARNTSQVCPLAAPLLPSRGCVMRDTPVKPSAAASDSLPSAVAGVRIWNWVQELGTLMSEM